MENSTFNVDDFKDPLVWDLLCEGKTKGVFQLESQLGRSWSKRTKPRSIEELAALISIIRPGCLKAFTEGKSMTQHYVDRKMGVDEVHYLHDSLESILKETYGVLVYQEQSMMIAQKLAGFNLEEADDLRKAIGKKKAALMRKVKKAFIKGASQKGLVTKGAAEEIFSWIEKSSRYAFNKSHAVSYAVNAYRSAYCKVHRKMKFFESYLNHSDRKPDSHQEIRELVSDAKLYDIEVLPPRLSFFYPSFTVGDGDKIYFGINTVKGVGNTETKKLVTLLEGLEKTLGKISDWTWLDVVCNIFGKVNKRALVALISVGAFTGTNNRMSRNQMLYEFDSWQSLTSREAKWVSENYRSHSSLSECVAAMINNFKISSSRLIKVMDIKNVLDNPLYDLTDHPAWIAETEESYMGCGLTFCKTDAIESNLSNCSCKEIALGTRTGKVNVLAQINTLREYRTKKGKTPGQLMGFLTIEDGSSTLDSVVIFPDTYEKYKSILHEGNTVIIIGQISSKKDGSLIINKVSQA